MVVARSRAAVGASFECLPSGSRGGAQAAHPRARHLDPVQMPLGFSRLQAANLVGWTGDPGHPECRKLLGRMAALLGDGAKSAPGPGPSPVTHEPKRPRLALRLAAGLAAAIVIGLAAYFGLVWYEAARFDRILAAVREQIQSAEADITGQRNRAARQKLDTVRLNLEKAAGLRPGAWQVEELKRQYAIALRRLWGAELTPMIKFDQDCPECPEMVDLPAGRFTMGSPDEAKDPDAYAAERPQHTVVIARPFAIGRFEVTLGQFELFVRAENYKPTADCRIYVHPGRWERDPKAGWTWPQFEQGNNHPVVCVNWHDAVKYAEWLSRKTGKRYRLPTEAEWEYAARAGSTAVRPWGSDPNNACRYGNVADKRARVPWSGHDCDDEAAFTAPVGSYRPNAFGLFDMMGNAWEWVQDCFVEDYANAPGDGSAVARPDCKFRVIRGGAWLSRPRDVRSAQRGYQIPAFGNYSVGFRVVREN
ncbi:MAG: formylglycine-generating enzyme family protein [Rhodospirillaceae bacterium]|nr:formylglycine-generating enzyme family protein [Rhodospirillaceae bacterium]